MIHITGVDLNLFDFDYDLTWAAFFMNADEKIYGRYGGRDAKSADDRMSLAGLRYAMQAALDAHRAEKTPAPREAAKPLLAENYPAAKNHRGCVHCHQVNEFRRESQKETGQWKRDLVWAYPLPENVGIILEVDVGNKVRSVKPGSPAAALGIRPGDHLLRLNGYPVASFADAQYALHKAPAKGTIAVAWLKQGNKMEGALEATLDLPEGWRKTNLTWRPSMLDILPSLSIYGEDLGSAEKTKLGLAAKRLAFRQQKPVPNDAKKVGVQEGDIILGVDGLTLEMTVDQFLGYVRQNYLVGEQITLNVLRDGKLVDLKWILK